MNTHKWKDTSAKGDAVCEVCGQTTAGCTALCPGTQPEAAKCELCGESMPPGEQMFKFHGYSGPCPKPPLPRRTLADAIKETERLLEETFDKLDPENERDSWFMTRLTKIRKALADRPAKD